MAKHQGDAVWNEIDPASLDVDAGKLYAGLKAARKVAAEAKAAFEEHMNVANDVPEGMRLVFGYNFGKLSIAVVEDDRKPKRVAPAKQTLAEFIAGQRASGARI